LKNPKFDYVRPISVAETVKLLGRYGDEAKVLAGGQSLLPILALRLGRPSVVVDIGRVEGLDQIVAQDDGSVRIGATVRHATVETSTVLRDRAPLLYQAVPFVGHRAIRNRGTICGSLAHADPAAELPAVAVAAGATMILQSTRGRRDVPAHQFFKGYLETAIEPEELLTEVVLPPWGSTDSGTIVEVSRRHGDYAIVGLAAKVTTNGFGTAASVADAALCFFGVAPTPMRVSEAEEILNGETLTPPLIKKAATVVSEQLTPTADQHGTTNYRKHLAGVLTAKALASLMVTALEAPSLDKGNLLSKGEPDANTESDPS